MENDKLPTQDPNPETLPKSNKTLNPAVLALLLIIGVLTGTMGTLLYFSKKVLNRESVVTSQNDAPANAVATNNSNGYEVDLTGDFYIGPKAFKLVYDTEPIINNGEDQVPEKGSYVLYGAGENEKYTLREEDYNACGFDSIFSSSPANLSENITRIIVNYYCGDVPRHILLGIKFDPERTKYNQNLPVYYYEPLDSREINLNDSYWSPQKVLGWITHQDLLVREAIRDEEGKNPEIIKYWKVNIENTADRKELII